MTQPPDRDVTAEFDAHYALVEQVPMLTAELSVIGADYGATSFTTMHHVEELAGTLDLSPEHHVLDIGSGTGWPGIYLAANRGCRVTLTDVPLEGLAVAKRRIDKDSLDPIVSVVAASAEDLPFRSSLFDVVTGSDVFC